VINELPYEKRLAKENMILAELWFGDKKTCYGNLTQTSL